MRKKHVIPPVKRSFHFFEIVLLSAFFFSGASSLSLEVAWSKELTYLLGVDTYATTTVVTAFMAGLGLGALLVTRSLHRVQTSIKTYGLLQVVIGCFGMISIPLFHATRPLFSVLYQELDYSGGWFLLIRFLVVFGFILIPVTLMGMTLPVVVGASYERMQQRYAYLAGRLYGVNTVGAVTGTLAAGFLLIPAIGIYKTCIVTGAVDLLIGCVMLWRVHCETASGGNIVCTDKSISGTSAARQNLVDIPSLWQSFSWPAAVFLLSGISALAYEIIWFRLLARIVGPSVHAFSMILAVYLLGIGLGSLAGARVVKKISNHRLAMSLLLAAIALDSLITLFFINQLPVWYGMLFVRFSTSEFTVWNLLIQGAVASVLILPVTLPMGAFFPVITMAYNREQKTDDRGVKGSVGHLYFYNTIGGVIGSLIAGFWLMPLVGIKTTIILAAGLNMGIALTIYAICCNGTIRRRMTVCGSAVAVFAIAVILSPSVDQTLLNTGLYSEMVNKEYFTQNLVPKSRKVGQLLYFHEGINNSVAVFANKFNDGNLTLHFSGCWEAATEIHGRMHLKFLGHLPMLFARKTETVAIVGFGAGITTGAVLMYPDVRRVNVFELESSVVEANKYFTYVNNRPLEDPRMHLYMVDGRSHMTYDTHKYDVITSDPIHPFVAGSANLYTSDYYHIMAERLNPGGIFCQWIPLVGISPKSYNTILNTMHQIFPHLAVFSFCGESVIIASTEPLRADWTTVNKRFYSPRVYADLKTLDVLTPFNLISFYMGAESQIDHYLSRIKRINTDDNVWIEHRVPMDVLNLSLGNLFFMLREKIPNDDQMSLSQVFPGIPLADLNSELMVLKKDGKTDYRTAQAALKNNDTATAEKYLRRAISDFNSSVVYPAGMQLIGLLEPTGRTDEILTIASFLELNFPAYPEAYIAEANVWEKRGNKAKALAVLNRGQKFAPQNSELMIWRKRIALASAQNPAPVQ